MDLSIITVTWNSKALIGEQIRSVKSAALSSEIEQIIIDNASTDGTVDFARLEFPEVRLIANQTNSGFAVANNQALAFATGKFLLFLNPDMRLEPGTLDTIVAWMRDRPHVGIVSPKLVDEHGNVHVDARPRRFPKLFDQLCLVLKLPHIFPNLLDHYLMSDFNPEREQTVDSVRGSFMLMRREMVEQLGWAFDPRYFFWFEDVDICREANRLGYSVMYTPVISAVDYVGQSFKQRTTLWKQKQFTKSMVTYFKKWGPWHAWMVIILVRPIGIGMAWLKEKITFR